MDEKIESLVRAAVEEGDFYLVRVRLERRNHQLFLEILVDRPGGITLDECAGLNKKISERIDRKGLIEEGYNLGVSSPGIDYPLTERADFERKINRSLSVSFYGEDGRSRCEEGELVRVDTNVIKLKKPNGGIVKIALDKVIKGKEKLEL